MRIIQLFYGNLYDDGVGNTVQTIDRQLKSMGYDAEMWVYVFMFAAFLFYTVKILWKKR